MIETAFDINELHKVQYDILLEFDRVCKKNNLTYYLGFGSMLGAVRHNGFIPWDDDIDILMLYKDFKALKELDSKEWSDGFFLQSPETDKEYNRSYIKIRNSNTTLIKDDFIKKDLNHGIAIDVEPLVSLADDIQLRKKQYRDTQIYLLMRYDEPPYNHGKIMNLGGKVLLALIPNVLKAGIREKYLKKVLRYESDNTEYLYVINGNMKMMHDLHRRKIFDEVILMKFENDMFPVPAGYDEWLTTRYGNYMELPPKDEQGIKLEHYVKVDTKRSYKEYKGIYYCK